MLKVLIVDDEQNFRFYLRDIINWDNYNCKIVATCETGDEALEIIQNQSVDLVLIDLKILEIIGLELIQDMKSRGHCINVIALGNLINYHSVKEAIKLGALDYYVKTNITEADIISVIDSVLKKIKKQLQQQNIQLEANRIKRESFKMGRKTFLTTIITGDIYYSPSELEQYMSMYHLFESQLCLYCLNFEKEIDVNHFSYIDAVIDDQFKDFDYDIIHLNRDKILVVLYEKVKIEEKVLIEIWDNIMKILTQYLESDLKLSNRWIIDSIKESTACLRLLQQDSVREKSPFITNEQLSNCRFEVRSILNYIHEHYHERITLQDLSAFACLNEAYLSRLFKAETKKTINSYINELRIYRAKELLKTPDIMVKEVAQLVGIKDQLYFNRVFKKFCGENPTDYQERFKRITL